MSRSPTPRLPLRLVPGSPHWPVELNDVEGCPDSLWLRGDLEHLSHPARIAIVGSRTPTPYGAAQARRFARAFAESGYCIVSGLARGVDQAAHAAALDTGGKTVAVLGSGVDCVWPRGQVPDRLLEEAAVVSEFEPEQAPRRHHFPLRNRLISGLAEGVLVVEAAFASGSLITGRWAADQGRPVWAIPGRVDHPMSRGCHRLIRDGAMLVESPADVLADLGVDLGESHSESEDVDDPLLRVLVGETLSCDEICARTKQGLSRVLPRLAQLELAGRIARAPGGLYRLRTESG